MPEHIAESQRVASDPRSSVWVTANAGSGKTSTLVDRVARLVLEAAVAANDAELVLRNLPTMALRLVAQGHGFTGPRHLVAAVFDASIPQSRIDAFCDSLQLF
eukprot:gene46233-62620_t